MAGGYYKIKRGESLTFWERLYLPEIFRGLSVTTRHFIPNWISTIIAYITRTPEKRKIMTIYYPEELPEIPDSYRGKPVLVRAGNGATKCVACGLCEVACPPKCISIVGGNRSDGTRYPETYTLDGSRCIFCGLCEEACPVEAIVMSHRYQDLCEHDRSKMIYSKEDLLVPEKDLQSRLDFIRRRAYGKCNY